MTTRQLGFKGPPQLSIAVGATTPNPGITGVEVWSTTANAMLQWTGSNWQRSGNAPGDLLSWNNPVKGFSGFGGCYPYLYGGSSLTTFYGDIAGSGNTGTLVYPSGADSLFVNTHIASDMTNTPASTYNGMLLTSAVCNMYRQAGLTFEAAAGLDTVVSRCGFIGLMNRNNAGQGAGTGMYQSTGSSDLLVGIGRDEGDPANACYLLVSDGTTRSKTLLTRTGAGYAASTGLTFQVQILCAPGAGAMTINVLDLSNNYPCLSNHSVSLATFPASAVFSPLVASATGATSGVPALRFYGMSYGPYPGGESFAQSASNILGNAATASELATPRTIQGVSFDGSANIDVISIGSVAPSTPSLNQLWIQTT